MTNRVDVTLYTRPGCHLCDEAAARLVELAEQLPIGVQAIDIQFSGKKFLLFGQPQLRVSAAELQEVGVLL